MKYLKQFESEYNRTLKKNLKHYCSLDCHKKSKRIIENKFCDYCGKIISFKKRNNKFCSKECRSKSLILSNRNNVGRKVCSTLNFVVSRNNYINTLESKILYDKVPKHCKECDVKLKYCDRKNIFCNINCKRKYDSKNLTEYQKYYKECRFRFNLFDYPNEFDFKLIEQYGWYQAKNHGNNLNGISRDHMISVKFGYENNIDPTIIKHPANCRLMKHNENSCKWKNCSITINELLEKIKVWNNKYGALTQSA